MLIVMTMMGIPGEVIIVGMLLRSLVWKSREVGVLLYLGVTSIPGCVFWCKRGLSGYERSVLEMCVSIMVILGSRREKKREIKWVVMGVMAMGSMWMWIDVYLLLLI